MPNLTPGATTEADARTLLCGDPVQRDDYDDGSYELSWSYRTQRLSTSVRLNFDADAVFRAVTSCSPEYIGLHRAADSDARNEGNARRIPRHSLSPQRSPIKTLRRKSSAFPHMRAY